VLETVAAGILFVQRVLLAVSGVVVLCRFVVVVVFLLPVRGRRLQLVIIDQGNGGWPDWRSLNT
jgi:hypothetical protein